MKLTSPECRLAQHRECHDTAKDRRTMRRHCTCDCHTDNKEMRGR
jgi:hypothetical protein